ncbi:hypothetical protein MRB53_028072 [Persea americana]|uniref:Uncharacterized protein n=1 Tax=Persea americana TaxID=3435 RepID=A0ACC2KF66_PERAE|nr:hypothetical protein MRB53_028072 [Persea americana]
MWRKVFAGLAKGMTRRKKRASDYFPIHGPFALLSKLHAVWYAAIPDVAKHYGVDATQFLLHSHSPPCKSLRETHSISDQFSTTTIVHIPLRLPAPLAPTFACRFRRPPPPKHWKSWEKPGSSSATIKSLHRVEQRGEIEGVVKLLAWRLLE